MTALILSDIMAAYAAQVHRRRAPVAPLSAADDSTFDLWLALPSSDARTIEEFADTGGGIRLNDWRSG